MYDMAENNSKKNFTKVLLTVSIFSKTVLVGKLCQKTSLTRVYSFAD